MRTAEKGVIAMTRDKFIKELEGYIKHIRFAYSYFDAYQAIVTGLYNNLDEVNLSPGFFTVAKTSLYHSLMMELAKLFCKRDSSERTISKLLNLLQDNRHLFQDKSELTAIIQKATAQLDKMEPEIASLKARRDEYLAHNDPIYFQNGFTLGNNASIGDGVVFSMLQFSENLCLAIFSKLDDRKPCFRIKNSGDLNVLLAHAKANLAGGTTSAV